MGRTAFPADVHSFGGYASNPSSLENFDPTTNLPVPGPNFSPIDLVAFTSRLAGYAHLQVLI